MIEVHDPLERKILGGTPIFPEEWEVLREGPWLKAAKRVTKRKDLFCAQSRKACVTLVGEWIVKPGRGPAGIGVATELGTMCAPPEMNPVDLISMGRMMELTRPGDQVVKELQQVLEQQRFERQEKARATAEARYAAAKHHLKKGNDELGGRLMMGEMPFVSKEEGGEQLAEMTEDLIRAAKHL